MTDVKLVEIDREARAEALRERDYTIYCCADATLTYAPFGDHKRKPIKRALPVLTVDSPEEAERIIGFVGSLTYIPDDPYEVKEGAGPASRHRYSLPDFVHSEWDTLVNVTATLDAIRNGRVREAFAEARARAAEQPDAWMQRPTADERIEAAERAIADAGYALRYVEWGEDAETPGLLGQIRGATSHAKRTVKIATKPHESRDDLAETLEHELRHVQDPSWDCGSRDVLGRGGPASG